MLIIDQFTLLISYFEIILQTYRVAHEIKNYIDVSCDSLNSMASHSAKIRRIYALRKLSTSFLSPLLVPGLIWR